MGNLPDGVDVVLRGALRGAQKSSNYPDGWECMYAAMKEVANNPHPFAEGGWTTSSTLMRMTRTLSQEKSWENGYKIVKALLEEMAGRRHLFVDGHHQVAVSAAIRAAAKASNYSNGYKIMTNSMLALASSSPHDARRGYFNAGLQGSLNNLSWENGYKCLMEFSRQLLSSGLADPFDRVTLENAVRGADRASNYSSGYKVLRQTFESLLR